MQYRFHRMDTPSILACNPNCYDPKLFYQHHTSAELRAFPVSSNFTSASERTCDRTPASAFSQLHEVEHLIILGHPSLPSHGLSVHSGYLSFSYGFVGISMHSKNEFIAGQLGCVGPHVGLTFFTFSKHA